MSNVATTILHQLGGNRFVAMTGAKNFVGGSRSLSMKLPSNMTRERISHVRITLDPSDTYTVTFLRIRGTKPPVEVSVFSDVYCDSLRSVFTSATGLLTSMRG